MREREQYLKVRVVNACDPDRPRGTGTGVGIQNVQRRLATVSGNDASLATRERDGRFEAEVILPFRTAGAAGRPAAAAAEVHA